MFFCWEFPHNWDHRNGMFNIRVKRLVAPSCGWHRLTGPTELSALNCSLSTRLALRWRGEWQYMAIKMAISQLQNTEQTGKRVISGSGSGRVEHRSNGIGTRYWDVEWRWAIFGWAASGIRNHGITRSSQVMHCSLLRVSHFEMSDDQSRHNPGFCWPMMIYYFLGWSGCWEWDGVLTCPNWSRIETSGCMKQHFTWPQKPHTFRGSWSDPLPRKGSLALFRAPLENLPNKDPLWFFIFCCGSKDDHSHT